MSLTQSHSALLKRYLKEEIIEHEMKEKSYIWKNVKKENDWAGGVLEIPVQSSGLSTIQMGSLAADTDIAEYTAAVGTVSAHKELTMSAIFREADLSRLVNKESSYIDNLVAKIESLSKKASEQIGANLVRGAGVLSYASANGDASGNITVPNPEYFEPKQKVTIDDDNSSPVSGYVRTVDIVTGILVIYDARTGGAAVDLSGYATANNAKVMVVGSDSEAFLDLKTACLPAAVTGGSATLYGLTKASYLPLQSYYETGASYAVATLLKDLLGAFYKVRKLGRGNQSEIWVSFGIFKNISAQLEAARQFMVADKSAGYGFSSVTLVGNEGTCKIVGLREMPDNTAYIVDWDGLKFKGMPLKKKMYGENNQEYYVTRATTGISFITDMALRGDFVIDPSKIGVVHSIAAVCSA
jgi:hypothetical protein